MLRTLLRVVCAGTVFILVSLIAHLNIFEILTQTRSRGDLELVYVHLLVAIPSLVLGSVAAAFVWGWTGRFSPLKLVVWAFVCVAVILAIGAAVVYFIYLFNLTFATYDSDLGIVAPESINRRLEHTGVTMPSEAQDVHVLSTGGLSPMMMLKFTVSPDEARRFLERLCASSHLKRNVGRFPEDIVGYGRVIDKTWWRPRSEFPWWYEVGMFLQVDDDSGTVYLMDIRR